LARIKFSHEEEAENTIGELHGKKLVMTTGYVALYGDIDETYN
jgi:hypothetical protein